MKKNDKKINWVNILILVVLGGIIAYVQIKKQWRVNHPMYVKGVVTGSSTGSKGTRYLDYSFKVTDSLYRGYVSIEFRKSGCCKVGDTVIVRYQKGVPVNNDLVYKIPSK